jgi:hypothetical protein
MKTEETTKVRFIPEFKPCKVCGGLAEYSYAERDGGFCSEHGCVRCMVCNISISISNKNKQGTIIYLEHIWNQLME